MIAVFIILSVHMMSLGMVLVLHGKEKKGKYNFWYKLLAVAILIFLYYKAGMFNVFNN